MNKIIYYIDVLLAHNVSEEFTYKHETIEKPRVGMIVLAPLRSGEKIGVITKVNSVLNDSKIKLKFIKEISPEYRLNSKMIKFLNWVSNYNLIDRGLVLKMILSHSKFYFKKIKFYELMVSATFGAHDYRKKIIHTLRTNYHKKKRYGFL